MSGVPNSRVLRVLAVGAGVVLVVGSFVALTGWATGPDVAVRDGTLPVDQNEIWKRVQSLQGTDVEPPRAIHVTGNLRDDYVLGGGFHALMGVGNTSFPSSEPGGRAGPSNVVYLRPKGAPYEVETILAHEYAHVIQREVGAFTYRGPAWDRPPTTDAEYAWQSTVEGAAEYVVAEYVRRYMENLTVDDIDPRTDYEGTSGGNRLFGLRYRFGHRYVSHRAGSPKELSTVYDDPPNTTEQVLHNHTREEEPPVSLSVRVEGHREDWELGERDRMGELFVRTALSQELSDGRAAEAAAGWGDDRLVPFENVSTVHDPLANWSVQEGYAWVLRWDTAEDADEFEAAFERYQDRRTAGTRKADLRRDGDAYFQVERPGRDTVVVLAGTTRLVGNASVEVEGPEVTVRLPDWQPERAPGDTATTT